MKRPLSLVAALVALWPSAAVAADVSNPDSLRAILPGALDTTYVEAVLGQSGFLEGPMTYDSITAYYTYYQQSAAFIDAEIGILKENGYVGGYQRSWYRYRTQDQLGERVMVFASASKATSAQASFKSFNAGNGIVASYFDPQLGPDAYGWVRDDPSYHFADVSFVRGDAEYDVVSGSTNALKAGDVTPQARALFAAAPTTVGIPPPPQSALARLMLPLVVTFLSGSALIAAALVLAVVATIRFQPAQATARRA